MKRFSIAILLLSLCLSVNSSLRAQQRTIPLENIIAEMKLNLKGRFPYGFKPNMLREKVKEQMAGEDLFQEDSLFVTYSVAFNDEGVDFCDISFDFPKGKLTSASIETYLSSFEQSNKSFNSVKDNFIKLYGPGEFRDDTFYWKYVKKGKTLEIQMWEVNYEDDDGYGIDFLYY